MSAGTADTFRAPAAENGPAVYWFWHGIPTHQTIRRQVRQIPAAGYSTVLVQARLAMSLADYLSPDYLAAYRFAVQQAAACGLEVGIYDDYNWISGHAGGRTVQGADQLREQHLFWARAELQKGRWRASIDGIASGFVSGLGPAAESWVFEGGKPAWGHWRLSPLRPAGHATSLTCSISALPRCWTTRVRSAHRSAWSWTRCPTATRSPCSARPGPRRRD